MARSTLLKLTRACVHELGCVWRHAGTRFHSLVPVDRVMRAVTCSLGVPAYGDGCQTRFLLLPRPAGEMSRSDRGGLALLDQIVRRRRNRDARPPSAFGISPRKAGGEFCKDLSTRGNRGKLGRFPLSQRSLCRIGWNDAIAAVATLPVRCHAPTCSVCLRHLCGNLRRVARFQRLRAGPTRP